ncbi:MAG: TrkA C-terminal domain-containing protein [Caldilineaceae bacterium]
MLAEPVVGYSIVYPMGVVGMILAIQLLQRLWRIDYKAEGQRVKEMYNVTANVRLHNHTLRITKPEATASSIYDLRKTHQWDVLFGRLKRGDQLCLATDQTQLQLGDLVSVVGTPEHLAEVEACLGEPTQERLELDRSQLDYRRIFVSDPKVAGHRLRDLNLPQQFGALVTRVRRGDIEFLPHGDTVLELGDRIRVVTALNRMGAVSSFFGDSYRALSEFDVLTFSLGLALGLLVGLVPLPLPGGVQLKLGVAGGPLVVAMVLATLRRTGPLVWNLPYSANLTLRQTGLILFLAGVGTRAGYTFVTTIQEGGGIWIFVAGVIITMVAALTTLWVGYKVLKVPMGLLIGILAGLQTQPAILGYALEQTRDDLPNIGYATVYPVATITKILLAQMLLTFLLHRG